MALLPKVGTVVASKYRVVRHIGDGGMGAVYEAEHVTLGNHVALKFLLPQIAELTGLAERFLREAQLCATIQSPHVTRVTDIDEYEGSPYLVMEFLRGDPLSKLLANQSRLPVEQAVSIGVQLLAGLEAAHARGVVHRDLKPDNIFIVPSPGGPLVKILDFGIAKLKSAEAIQKVLTQPGVLLGTPQYMAPEQAYSADTADPRSDLYSVGVILYEMCAGARPVEDKHPHGIASKVLLGDVVPLASRNSTLPGGLAEVVHRALQGKPEQRFSSALEMRRALIPFAGRANPVTQLAINPRPVGINPTSQSPTTQPIDAVPLSMGTDPSGGRSDTKKEGPKEAAQPAEKPAEKPGPTATEEMSAFSPAEPSTSPVVTRDSNVDAPALPPTEPGAPAKTLNAPAASPLAAPQARRKGRTGLWVALLLGLGAAAAGGYWYLEEHQSLPPPPPQPRDRITSAGSDTVPAPDPHTEDDDPLDEPETPAGKSPRRPSSPGPRRAASPSPTPAAPAIPPFQLPSALPALPEGLTIPSALPSLEDLGLKPPTAAPAGGSAGAPGAGGGP